MRRHEYPLPIQGQEKALLYLGALISGGVWGVDDE